MITKEKLRIGSDGTHFWIEQFNAGKWSHLHGKFRDGHTFVYQYYDSLVAALVSIQQITTETVYFDADGNPL